MSGGDGHGGWLISASKSVLNLWECNLGGGGGGDAPLQVRNDATTVLHLQAKGQEIVVLRRCHEIIHRFTKRGSEILCRKSAFS